MTIKRPTASGTSAMTMLCCSYRCQQRQQHRRLLLWLVTVVSVLWLMDTPVSGQSVDIHVTVKEERLPGTEISDLMTEPRFIQTINGGSGSGSGGSSSGSGGGGSLPPPTTTTDATPNLQFKVLASGNPVSRYFSVDKSSGIVSIAEKIDREKVCSFRKDCELRFELAATSVYSVFFVLVNFRVTVLDINDNPPEFTQPEFDLFIPENAERGRSFQLPTAFDRDTGPDNGVTNYSLLTQSPLFELKMVKSDLNTSDVYLSLVSTVNRESADSYTLVVGATDGGTPALTGLLTISVRVSDINDNFPVFEQALYQVKVPEDQRTDKTIVQVRATDADEGANGELVYSFSPMQPQENLAFFRVDPVTGEVFLAQSIESRTGQYLDLVVEAKDKGRPPKVSTCTIKIFVEDTVNSMPEIILDSLAGGSGVAEVSEYANVGKVMLHVSVRDRDSGDNGWVDCRLDSPEFKLVKLSNDGKFKVALASKLNREIVDFYNVSIFCSDHGFFSLMATAKFHVRVLDENDNEPVFSRRTYEASIQENNTIGASIIQLTVTDQDIGINAQVDFTVLGINDKYFAVDSTGKMTAKVPLDREESDRIVVKVKATDRGYPRLSSSATVVVDLMDVNDMPPAFAQKVYQFDVSEEQAIGRYIGIVSAADQDLGENRRISYTLSTAAVKEFVVGEEGGVLKTNVVLDREEQLIYEFYVKAVDHGVPALTGTTRVIIHVLDVNDNIPYFKYPIPGNDSLRIPHTYDKQTTIVAASALDLDDGLNARITYSLNCVNASSRFAIHPDSGNIYLEDSMQASEVGLYILTLVASDRSLDAQLATQTPFYIDVFFDNTTLLANVNQAGPGQTVIVVLIAVATVALIGTVIVVAFICLKRSESNKRNGFPISASTSSTTKLQGGYYIAPGVRASSSTFLNKPGGGGEGEGTINRHADTCSDTCDTSDIMQVGNPYVAMAPGDRMYSPSRPVQPEIVQISRGAHHRGGQRLDDTLNTLDLDQTDDGQFSTFKSQENILAPGPRHDSLRRQSAGTPVYKSGNDTFDELSCDSTSDSGRGGSDVDVNNGAAASRDKARAKASTPVSMKSGISDRLSPLPRDPRLGGAFVTFRGESPSSFKFDSDSDATLTRQPLRSRFSPLPVIASPGQPQHQHPNHHPDSETKRNSGRLPSTTSSSRLSESDTDTDATPTGGRGGRIASQPSSLAGMYPGGVPGGYNSGGEGPSSSRQQPFRVAPLPTFMPPPPSSSSSRRLRYDDPTSSSEPEHSDGGSSSMPRRNIVPRLPVYSGIDFTHHAYGGSNRNSIGAFTNLPPASAQPDNNDYTTKNNNNNGPHSSPSYPNSSNGPIPPDPVDSNVSSRFGNVLSELNRASRPISTDEDFLLPPYPSATSVAEEDEQGERTRPSSRYAGGVVLDNRNGERDSLMSARTYSEV